ncbi:PhzF family phenazine biosynthesis protein [Candidatus Aminicenantes bacterium AC-335-A11]|jgi:trans-2,3-dihydro-3-hydroxyanthranilate isomerase|nr:PhzF family phenazine biosynthesis protein [SCandidatus Aminicenantes bacterium Aminicenantia_JdfR_composite]MCP2597305.1 PhzF family phenazine biosynthesis protein [Candidatus Aminicenantes bacterium AC-335-G13]MCP2598099.1 PhzF family phenazine biosynthesis protein [Candidatus Aminicenantes bacterium AC-335-L06]MCP2606237.1 PhzF family phenazine biosynthesis protein [Candidatus Aminicenantes bacterium AC-708-I09]MCP2618023.1 PhzF family phenazine biosynthesis protein [Candidatus Aminicenan
MSKLTFYIVDVFAEEKYEGNQLAVFRNAGKLSDEEMQCLAKEMNYSETTFILSEERRNGGYDVRIFTPEKEIPFAGHPTLGTAYVIQREIIGEPVSKVILNLGIGQIPVTVNYKEGKAEILWMKQKAPVFGKIFDREQISEVLNISKREIDDRFPVQEVSTGLPFIIVPLKTLDVLKKAQIKKEAYFELIENTDAKAILVFSPETYKRENDLNVRVFADYYGVPEDPATGSANGCLAGYLVKYRYFDNDRIDIRVEQGYEIGRPSLLFLRAEEKETKINVSVGGKVIMIAKGELVNQL